MTRLALALPLVLVAGCATAPKTAVVDGKIVPRLTLAFTGQPYEIKHEGAHPQPGSPSGGLKDAGGSIHGRICGMFVDFDVTHKGDHVQLVGSIDNKMPAAIDVSEENGSRHFTGNLGGLGVDFVANTGGMQGHVGIRVFAVDAAADGAYHGFMRIPGLLDIDNSKQRIGVVLRGREAAWAMPPADQAAIIPSLLTCGGMQFRMVDAIDVGFGGTATDRPPETSAVYTKR
ncbi:MAG TPA: hypothetical protein VGL86_16725 [Polyangia bacterium]|jgi:hypothetical protein